MEDQGGRFAIGLGWCLEGETLGRALEHLVSRSYLRQESECRVRKTMGFDAVAFDLTIVRGMCMVRGKGIVS